MGRYNYYHNKYILNYSVITLILAALAQPSSTPKPYQRVQIIISTSGELLLCLTSYKQKKKIYANKRQENIKQCNELYTASEKIYGNYLNKLRSQIMGTFESQYLKYIDLILKFQMFSKSQNT